MQTQITHNLQAIGLSEKEAQVYLAALSLGATTAQMLAAKATINRPTTYIMIESLMKRGLMSAVIKGKKRYFTAAEPNQLLELMAGQRKELQKKEEIAREMLPDLMEIAGGNNGKTAVRVFEGDETWSAVQRDILASGVREIRDLSVGADAVSLRGALKKEILEKCKVISLQSSSLDESRFPVKAEMVLYGSKSLLVSHAKDRAAILIDDAEINTTLTTMFNTMRKAIE